ncbi:MAG: Uncharacterised protein [SAR116 cluster bacterium]|nr:MAG: Uncharacterised protein [SAR116 cluster bacterium]
MKKILQPIFLLMLMTLCADAYAQFGMGRGMGRNPYTGRRQSLAPQEPMRQEKPENLTAEQIVDQQMPALKEAIGLTVFEEAVVRTILINSVQKSIELQLLKLDQDKIKTAVEKIQKEQEEALKNGLPEEKYLAFVALQEEGFKKPKKEKKKKKRKKNKS